MDLDETDATDNGLKLFDTVMHENGNNELFETFWYHFKYLRKNWDILITDSVVSELT